ncbi:MAG: DEAD/DEAH box helicase [Alphaproteobacteria bacterium]|nr:DEAD/DEAH box helicase [Alphaproteobacteria bacterium]
MTTIMQDFSSLNLPPQLMAALAKMGFTTPTPIQAKSIPEALAGRDVLGSAQTGTGKTGAFGIPLVNRLLTNPRGSALILCPTRELAVQVQQQLDAMVGAAPIKSALLIGGDSMPKQLTALRMRPRIIVGTPGRINDHLERGSLMLHDANFLVLDETDRMLDMGFGPQIDRIFKFLPAVRQTLMFSATLPDNIIKISQKYLNNPVRVAAGEVSKPIAKITQENISVTDDSKYDQLVEQLNTREGSVIVFVKTKWGAEKLAKRLRGAKHSADAIHGDLRQNQRDKVIKNFREMKHRILVATDIAARGLDIPHIEHVINYDLPQVAEDYIHRIGRTGRNEAEGAAVNLIAPADKEKWMAIAKLLDPEAYKKAQADFRTSGHSGKPGSGRPANNNNKRRRFRSGPRKSA